MKLLGAKTFKNYIDGEWVDAASGETFESTSPANGDTIGVFPKSGAEDVDRAVAAAKAAFEEWRLVPAPKRGEILFRFAHLVTEAKDELTELMSREMGKVTAEAGGDVQEAIDMSYYMAGEGRRLYGQTTPSELQDKFNMSVRMPIGVVGVITPWNFPIAIPSWKIAPALVAGNTVVFKPATDTPLLGERFVELLDRGGRPEGRRQHRPRRRRRGRRRARPSPGRARDHADRVARDRRAGAEERRRRAQARPPRARRQERDHRAWTTPTSTSRSTGSSGRRSAPPGQRCTAASRVIVHRRVYGTLVVAPRPGGRAAEARRGLGRRDRHRPGHQRARAREDPLVHRDRPERGRRPAHRRRGRERQRPRQGLLLPPDGLRRRPARTCGSPRRRSSARRRR